MHKAIRTLVVDCSWRLRALFRVRRFYDFAGLVRLYKAHVLSHIEYRSGVLCHAASSVLAPLDNIQSRFLKE